MAIKTGLAAQFGMVGESVYGTGVTVTRFLEFVNENITTELYHPRVVGLGPGRYPRTTQAGTPVIIGASGDVEFEVANKGYGLLFKHMLGKSTVAQVGSTDEYTHTCVPDDAIQTISATLQVGRPGVDGTVYPFTYEGAVCLSWSLNQQVDDLLRLTTTWDIEDAETATALASASYAAGREWFHHANLSVTIDGSEAFTRSLVINGDNGMEARRGVNGRLRRRPLPVRQMAVTGTLDAEFEDDSMYDALVAGTPMKLVATWTGSTIPEESNPYKLVVTIENFKMTGDPPNVGGPEIVRQPINFEALFDGTNPLIEVVYHTTDTAA